MKRNKIFRKVGLVAISAMSAVGTLALVSDSKAVEGEELAKRQCRSIHLSLMPEKQLDEAVELFYNEMTVDKSAVGTYFMAAGFDGGYFGIQELYDGKKIALFSVWDPGNPHNLGADKDAVADENRVIVLDSGKNVHTQRFGGEGTGAQAKFPLDWKIGETYQFVVTAKPAENPDGTIYSGYIKSPKSKNWMLMATYHTKLQPKSVKGPHTFVEDFRRNYESTKFARKASYGNAWVRTVSGKWHPLVKAKFTADPTPSMHINADTTDKLERGFYLETGGETVNKTKLWSVIDQPQTDNAVEAKVPADVKSFPRVTK